MNEAKLRHGQAIAMQWVAFLLQKIDLDIKKGGSSVRALLGNARTTDGREALGVLGIGCNYAANIVLPLTIELALKSLILKEGRQPRKIHNLVALYAQLSKKSQESLEYRYRNLKTEAQAKDFKTLLADHEDDFEGWRYLDEAEKLKVESIHLQEATCVILDECKA